jgi:predicted enzyme related to lactoylglutathione lyase
MLRGMATVSYWADDLEAARNWYAELLDMEPYFERPGGGAPAAYYEFRPGDYQHELGLIDRRYMPAAAASGPGGVVVYWHVDDVAASLERLLAMGATVHEPLTERGEGWITASVVDPFGNILGIMHNPLYLEVLDSFKNA